MKLIGIMRKLSVTNHETWIEASTFSRTIYAPVECIHGRDLSRMKKTAMGMPIQNPMLQCRHETDGGEDNLVSSAGIHVKLNI